MKLHLPKMLLAAVLVCVNSYALTVDTSTTPGSTIVTNENQTWSKTYTNVHVPTKADDIPESVVEATIITSGQLGQDSQDYSQIGNAGDIIVGGSGQLILQTWLRGAISMDNDIYLGSTTATQALLLKEFSGSITLNGSLNLVENSIISMEGKTSNPININGATNGSGYTLSAVGIKNTTFAGTVNLGGLSTTSTNDVPTSQFTFANTTTIGTLTLGNATELTFKGYEKTATIGTVTGDASLALTIAEGTTLDIQGGSVKLSSLENNGTLRLNAAITATGVTRNSASANGYVLSKEILSCGNIELGSAASINGVSATEYSLVDGTYTRTLNQAETGDMYHVVSGTVNIGDVATSVTDTHKGYVVYNQATLDLNGTQSSGQRVELRKGATLANSSTTDISNEAGTNVQQLKELVLEGDATVSATSNLGVCAGSHAQAVLDLGGHKLTKIGDDMFSVVNATISAGSIDIQNGKVKLLDKSNTQGGALSIDSGVAVNIAQGATLEWWSDQTASQVNGAFLKNLTGTGTVKIDHGQGGEVYIEGVASSAGPAHKIDFSGIIEMSSDTTLVLGAKHKGNENYDHAGWALDMSNTTISLNGGGLRFCGNATTIGTVDVNAADTLLYHDSRDSAGDTGLTIKTLNLDAQLSITRRWKGGLNVETLQGAGDLDINTGNKDVVVNIASTAAGYNGTISTQSGSLLNLGTADTTVNLAKTIENAGTVNLAGAINVTSDGNYTLYTLGETSYSADNGVNGFRTTAGSKYYLVKGQGTTTLDGTVLWDGTAVETTSIESGDEKGLLFTAGTFTDESAYYVNTTVSSDVQNTAKYVLNAEGAELKIASGSLSNSRIQYKAGAVNVNGNTLLLDTATSDVSSVLLNTTGSGTVQLAVNAQINNNEATKATGKLQISNGAELTLGNGDLNSNDTTPAANINTFTSLELDNGKLYINTRTLGLKNVTVTGNGGRIHMFDIGSREDNAVNLAETTTLNGDLKLNNSYNAQINVEKLAGSGKLVIEETSRLADGGETLKVTVSGKDSGYTGEVQVKNSADRLVVAAADDLGLNIRYSTRSGTMDLSSIGSGNTVILNGAAGGIKAGTIAADVKLENTSQKAGVEILTAGDDDSITYTGKISGGNYLINSTKTVQVDDGNGGTIEQQVAVNTNTTFSGDTSEWTGQMRVIKGEQNITFTGNATTSANSWVIESGATANVTLDHAAAATVKQNIAKGNGTLNLTVKNSSTEGTTLNAANVNALSVGADTKLSLAGAAKADSVTMAEGASLNFAGGSLTTSDSLTLNAISIDFSKYATTQLEHTLVSASSLALGASVNLESLGSTVGAYTATISQNGGELLLTYAVTPAKTIDWSITDLGGYDPANNILTLNVGAELTGYDFTQNGTIIIPGISDSIMKEILGLTGLPEDGMVGIQLMGADGQGLTATADQMIGFQGKDGVYWGTNVGSNWQYYVQYIPEPATATLSLLALAGLAARRRRK